MKNALPVKAGTISGTVRLRRLTARSLTVNSVSGDVEMEDVTAERMGAQSISGNITFAGALQPNGRYEFAAHSGNVRLAVPASTVDPCCFMNAPMACPICLAVNELAARKASSFGRWLLANLSPG